MRRWLRLVSVLVVGLSASLLSAPRVARTAIPVGGALQASGSTPWQQPGGSPLAPGTLPRKTPKLDSALDRLYAADQAARANNQRITRRTASLLPADLQGFLAARMMRIDDDGNVQVFVTTDGSAGAEADLAALGMRFETVDDQHHIVQGTLPIDALDQVAALPSVVDVRRPDYGFVSVGSKTTEGDSILQADSLRNTIGVSGQNVRVGIISDGMDGLAASQASHDLAAVNTTTCNKAPMPPASPPAPQPLPTDPGAGAEGTAMAEIVHDLAPSAELWFGYFGYAVGGTALDFNNAVNCLAANVDVVVDDIGWFIGPYDGTSLVSQNTTNALNNGTNRIRGYYTAVGNMAFSHYRETFTDSGFVINEGGVSAPLHRWQSTANTTDGGFGVPCTGGSPPFCFNIFVLPPQSAAIVNLSWNDPFGASTNDYDLFLFDLTAGGTLVGASTNAQTGSQNPVEAVVASNTDTVNAHEYAFAIAKYAGVAKTLNVFLLCPNGCAPNPTNGTDLNFNTTAGSVANEGDAGGGVVSVGAIKASDPTHTNIEYYSSRGPTQDNRTKPDISGIDCVQVTGDGGFLVPFCGTSAAAPHIAGIAALLLSCNPVLLSGYPGSLAASTARNTLRTGIESSAVPLGVGVPNNTFGYGRANAVAAEVPTGCKDTDGDGYPDGLETTLGKDPNTYCAIMRADVNDDGWVSIIDMALIGKAFGTTVPPTAARLDQDKDSLISILDMAAVGKQFGKNVAACP